MKFDKVQDAVRRFLNGAVLVGHGLWNDLSGVLFVSCFVYFRFWIELDGMRDGI